MNPHNLNDVLIFKKINPCMSVKILFMLLYMYSATNININCNELNSLDFSTLHPG